MEISLNVDGNSTALRTELKHREMRGAVRKLHINYGSGTMSRDCGHGCFAALRSLSHLR